MNKSIATCTEREKKQIDLESEEEEEQESWIERSKSKFVCLNSCKSTSTKKNCIQEELRKNNLIKTDKNNLSQNTEEYKESKK